MFRRDSLSPERIEDLVEKIAQAIVRGGLEDPIKLALMSFRGVSYFFGQQGLFFVAPYLDFLIGEVGEDFFLLIQDKKNINRLIERIEELSKLKESSKKESKTKGEGLLSRLRKKFS